MIFTASGLYSIHYWGEGLFFDFGYSSKFVAAETTPLQGIIGGNFQKNKFNFSGLVALDGYAFDTAFSLSFNPLSFKVFSFEAAYKTHLAQTIRTELNPNVTQWDNAFLCNFIFENKEKTNPLFTKIGLGINFSNLWQKLTANTLKFQNNYMLIEIQFIKPIAQKHEIMFRLATYDPLYFNTLLSTWWQFGYSYDITEKITTGTLLEVLYTDQFTLSGTVNGFQGKLFMVYRW